MKITYLTWGYSNDNAIMTAFQKAGIALETVELLQRIDRTATPIWEEGGGQFLDDWEEKIKTSGADIVFSVNFFACVSDLCQNEKIPYCSWILELPNFDLYTESVRNPCNFLGICDSYLVSRLWQIGAEKAFFLPDAVQIQANREKNPFEKGGCFIDRYPKKCLDTGKMTKYSRGYLEAFLHSQRVLYGASILEEGLLLKVQQEVVADNPVPQGILTEMRRLYTADHYLAPACDQMRQEIFLYRAASCMTIYSDGEFSDCDAEKRPFVEEEEQRQEIYAKKEFTLVLAPYTMHDGIPRQTLEVIAAGGFPIAGFVKDYAYFFKKDETLAYFTTFSEFRKALVRYGNDKDERERVREAAFSLVQKEHTYEHRINMMLEMWGKL